MSVDLMSFDWNDCWMIRCHLTCSHWFLFDVTWHDVNHLTSVVLTVHLISISWHCCMLIFMFYLFLSLFVSFCLFLSLFVFFCLFLSFFVSKCLVGHHLKNLTKLNPPDLGYQRRLPDLLCTCAHAQNPNMPFLWHFRDFSKPLAYLTPTLAMHYVPGTKLKRAIFMPFSWHFHGHFHDLSEHVV